MIEEIKNFLIKHNRTLLVAAIILYTLYSWPDIKQGILDGWFGK
jgi:hypothetical protein